MKKAVSLRTVVRSSAIGAIALAMIIAGLLIGVFHADVRVATQVNAELVPVQQATSDLVIARGKAVEALVSDLAPPTSLGTPALLAAQEDAQRAQAQLVDLADHYFSDAAAVPGEDAIEEQVRVVQKAGASWDAGVEDAMADGDISNEEAANLSQDYVASANQLARLLSGELQVAGENLESTSLHLELILIGAAVALLIAMLLAWWGVSRGVIRPLEALNVQLRRARRPEARTEQIQPSGPAELRATGADAEALRSELVRQIDEVRGAQEALGDEAPLVRELRRALTPPPTPARVVLESMPAEGVLAGDWIDWIDDGGASTLVIGDVSGHGAQAALLSLRLREAIRSSVHQGSGPAKAAQAAWQCLKDSGERRFASILIVRFDADTLTWTNCGHPPALLRGRDGIRELERTGPIVSVLASTWTQESMPVDGPEVLLAITDGVSEMRTGSENSWTELGEDWARTWLDGHSIELGAQELSARLRAALREAGGSLWGRDDVTYALVDLHQQGAG